MNVKHFTRTFFFYVFSRVEDNHALKSTINLWPLRWRHTLEMTSSMDGQPHGFLLSVRHLSVEFCHFPKAATAVLAAVASAIAEPDSRATGHIRSICWQQPRSCRHQKGVMVGVLQWNHPDEISSIIEVWARCSLTYAWTDTISVVVLNVVWKK